MILLRTFIVVLLLACGLTVGVVAAKSNSLITTPDVQSNIQTDNKLKSFKNQAEEEQEVDSTNQTTSENDEDVNSMDVKSIVVSLKEQRFYAFNSSGRLIFKFAVSSGRSGFGTPTGHFRIWYKATATMSRKYKAMMYHWMAFTPSGSHGFHGLAGRSYYNHLGSPASHGCVRLAREDAKEIYPYVRIGTPVEIIRGGLYEPVLQVVDPVTVNPQIANASSQSIRSSSRSSRSHRTTSSISKAKESKNETKPTIVETKPQEKKASNNTDSKEKESKKEESKKEESKPKEDTSKPKYDDSSNNEDGAVYF